MGYLLPNMGRSDTTIKQIKGETKMKGFEIGKPFYQANVWIKNGLGDP